MRLTTSLLLLVAAFGLASCSKSQPPPQDQNIEIGEDNTGANTEIETLPADESDTTPSNQLVNGADNPDVNGTTNSSE